MTALAFDLPRSLEAGEPPEARGLTRDSVRLMVASRSHVRIEDRRFEHLPQLMAPGDLLVINVSATLPAALAVTRGGADDPGDTMVHVATRAPGLGERWRVIELRSAGGARPARARPGERLRILGGDGQLEVVAPYATSARLVLTRFDGPLSVDELLRRHGRPIRYGHVDRRWPLTDYQTVYASRPGSAEMASAGRPFTTELITRLVAGGVAIAPIVLHAGVSSPERHEPPFPEPFEVPGATARLVNATRAGGGRVIAVGTTVVRALETVAQSDGTVTAGEGWTNVVVTPERGVRAIDGLITGWHEPQASHLRMLAAIAGRPLLARCYERALAGGYLWHEFGDSHLIMP